MVVKDKVYKYENKDVVIEVELVFEGSGNPTDDHTITGVVIKENGKFVKAVGKCGICALKEQ